MKPVLIALALVVLIGGGFSAYEYYLTDDNKEASQEAQTTDHTADAPPTDDETAELTEYEKVLLFAQNLSTCSEYQGTFIHPFTGEIMQREIRGIVDDKCNYIEEMPNNGQKECNYSEDEREAVAAYYTAYATGDDISTSGTVSLDGAESTTEIDGTEIDNPLQDTLENGTCVITGY